MDDNNSNTRDVLEDDSACEVSPMRRLLACGAMVATEHILGGPRSRDVAAYTDRRWPHDAGIADPDLAASRVEGPALEDAPPFVARTAPVVQQNPTRPVGARRRRGHVTSPVPPVRTASSWLTSWADAEEVARQHPAEEIGVSPFEVDPLGTIQAWIRGVAVTRSGSCRLALAYLAATGMIDLPPLGRPPRGGRAWSRCR